MAKFGSSIFTALLLCIFSATAAIGEAEHSNSEKMSIDTNRTSLRGNRFTVPAEWSLTERGPASIIEAPEGNSWIVVVDVDATSSDEAMAAGWSAYKKNDWPLITSNEVPDDIGWSRQRRYQYQTSPNERRVVSAGTMYANNRWSVWIYDMAHEVGEKRSSEVSVIFRSMMPEGYNPETFLGKKANKLNKLRIAELLKFVEDAQKLTRVPGVSFGIIQDGNVVFSGGFGVRDISDSAPVDGDTLYRIASNTKALTTLLLATLVDNGELQWNTPVKRVYPSFKLGDGRTTERVQIEHLLCACTGMPRQDMEWLFQFGDLTAKDVVASLGVMQPTSEFGELFQYSNTMAAAAGYVAASLLYPSLELGAAYDRAMQIQVFSPLGMNATTFDDRIAKAGNYASGHTFNFEGESAQILASIDTAVNPVRPAGGAWSSVNDMLKFIAMELDNGKLPNGKPYIGQHALFERREAKVAVGKDVQYGMGLFINKLYGTPVVHHGGSLPGYYSDMMWLPEHDVGAVILTNGAPGWQIHQNFSRKLLELLFDGEPIADESLIGEAQLYLDWMATYRELLEVPADKKEAAKLASCYSNNALGEVRILHTDKKTRFNVGEWASEVAAKKNPDGTRSYVTIGSGIFGSEFVVGSGTPPNLVLRDAQHEYLFEPRCD